MAGMFYSLEEVAEKLNKTEEEVKDIVRSGRLREFRDGPNLLFKVDEVEALVAEQGAVEQKEVPDAEEQEVGEDEISLAPEMEESAAERIGLSDDTIAVGDDDTILTGDEAEKPAGEETSVLGDTDRDLDLAADTMGETQLEAEKGLGSAPGQIPLDSSSEASLEAIEDDVNLDTFGSGSGLLDLSLQADDTSLGGILDEIYTPDGDEGGGSVGAGSALDVAAETEQMLAETAARPGLDMPAFAAGAYVEPEPDAISNALGIMLFLPFLALVYMAVVAIAGFNNVVPVILEKIPRGIVIWYVMAGVAVIAGAIPLLTLMVGGSGSKVSKKPKAKKPKKEKKAKPAKVKKEKKPKKQKKSKKD